MGGIACKSPRGHSFSWRNRVQEERQKRDIWQELGLEMPDDPSEGTMRAGSKVDIGWDSHSCSTGSQESVDPPLPPPPPSFPSTV